MTEEQDMKQEVKQEKESPELKEELTEEELKGVDGGSMTPLPGLPTGTPH